MSEERDIFSESVKGQLDNLEIPYNEAHWKDMEQDLDKMNPSDFAKPSSNVKYYVAAGVGVALIAGYFLINIANDTEESSNPVPETEEMVITSPDTPELEEQSTDKSPQDSKELIPEPAIEQEVTQVEKVEDESGADKKPDKYASRSEDLVKKEGKQIADDLVQAQKIDFKNVPNIDNPALESEIVISSKGPFCVGDDISFKIEPTRENLTYSWNFGDRGLTSRKQSPNHVFKHAGTFEIIVFVSKGEKNDFKATRRITIENKPEVEMSWSHEKITLNDPYLKISAKCNSKCEFNWIFNENTQARGKEVSFLIPDKGYYAVELSASSENGCSSKLKKTYNAEKGVKVFAEDAFTPNGDMNNDDFLPKELKDSYVEFNFEVSDMNGKKVFETKDKYQAWNGSLNNNGNILPAGLYHWVLKFKDDRGLTHDQEGKINLIK